MAEVNNIKKAIENFYGTELPPCKEDCPDRCGFPNCHCTCKKYLDWKSRQNQAKIKERNESYFRDYECERIIRNRKR